ncbi:MAG: toxin [Balneolaceae bacterium]|jgi:uncharacterized DUF497 family protein|nr:MAG: toxin [Balneolaceae bacterium]
MKYFDWDEEKNLLLKENRKISFEEIVFCIVNGQLLDVVTHHIPKKYPDQKIMIVEVDGYAYIVPFIEKENVYLLKTIYPSRKATRKYLNKDE